MAASNMRNRRHVQPLLTWSTNAACPVSLDQEPYRVLSAGPAELRFFTELVTAPPPPFSSGLGTGKGGVPIGPFLFGLIGPYSCKSPILSVSASNHTGHTCKCKSNYMWYTYSKHTMIIMVCTSVPGISLMSLLSYLHSITLRTELVLVPPALYQSCAASDFHSCRHWVLMVRKRSLSSSWVVDSLASEPIFSAMLDGWRYTEVRLRLAIKAQWFYSMKAFHKIPNKQLLSEVEPRSDMWWPTCPQLPCPPELHLSVVDECHNTGSTTQWQDDLAPKEMAASDTRNRRHVQPLLTWSTNGAHPTGSTTQWQADLAPEEMAASDMRNRRHVQLLLTWSTDSSCIPGLGALTGYSQPGQLSPVCGTKNVGHSSHVASGILQLAGIAVLSLGLWLYFNHVEYLKETPDNHLYFVPLYILIAAGAVMTILGFLGCCGALHESQTMLGLFFVTLLLVFVAEIICGVYAWQHKDMAKESLSNGFKILMQKYDEKDETNPRRVVDIIQHDLRCCGAKDPSDWADTDMNKAGVLTGLAKVVGAYKLPASCCATSDLQVCEASRQISAADLVFNSMNKEGCMEKLSNMIEMHMTTVACVGIGLGLIQILGLLFSILLCCAIRSEHRGQFMKA
ncbi:CD9 [Cordylochernes scorpioides]|uniref:CD9 n=1 Tax=Cordylochernes scorpioides TaxID=51811 RepID=A0ABY6LDY7_9ARAC|nr:CD9 [Cordylochernes scorpioides]